MMIPTHIDNASLNSRQSCEILLAKDLPPFQIFQIALRSRLLIPDTKYTLFSFKYLMALVYSYFGTSPRVVGVQRSLTYNRSPKRIQQ